MEKHSYLRTSYQNMKHWLKWSNHNRPAKYEDKLLKGGKKPAFNHSWNNMVQMHDLRVWTIA